MRNVIITGGNSGGSYASSTLEVRGPGDYSRFGLKPGIPMIVFPDGFKWGSAVWALGVEGAMTEDGKAPTVLERHFVDHPEFFFEGIGPDETLDWRHDYDRFAECAASLGHNSFRTGLLWARLMPDGKHVSESAVAFYRSLFGAFKGRGMELSVVLYWFDMPVWAEDRGGFTRRDIEDAFVRYCETAFDLFGDLVDIWYVYNEPTVDILMKYAWRACYPNRWTCGARQTSSRTAMG